VLGLTHQEGEKLRGRGVRPLQIFDDQHQRRAARIAACGEEAVHVLHRLHDPVVEAELLAVLGRVGVEPRGRHHRPEDAPDLIADVRVRADGHDQLAEDVEERGVDGLAVDGAAAAENAGAVELRAQGGIAHDTALPHPLRSGHDDPVATPVPGLGDQVHQLQQLRFPADQRRRVKLPSPHQQFPFRRGLPGRLGHRLQQRRRGGVAVPGILLEHLHDDQLKGLGHLGIDGRGVANLLIEVHSDHVDGCLAITGERSGDGLVERHPQGVEVGAGVDPVLAQHLRGHVLQGAADLPVQHLSALDGQTEVHDLGLAGLIDQDIGRLEIEMDDAQVVDVMEGGGDLQDHLIEARPVAAVEELGDAPARKVLHRKVREAIGE